MWIQEKQVSGLKDEVERKGKKKVISCCNCTMPKAYRRRMEGGELRKKQTVTANHAKPTTSKSAC
jgi:hypothetical protein